jgi:flagellar biosynthesis/type III secretory pathway protein FliH
MTRIRQAHLDGAFTLNTAEEIDQERRQALSELQEAAVQEGRKEADRLIALAKQAARQLIEKAQADAQAIVDAAEGGKHGIHQEAYQAGYQDGLAQGHEEATQAVQQAWAEKLASANILIEQATIAEHKQLYRVADTATKLIIQLGQRIHQAEWSAQDVLPLVNRAIDQLKLTRQIKVVMNEGLLSELNALVDLSQYPHLHLTPDPQLSVTDVYLLSLEGNYDVGPLSQWTQYEEALKSNIRPLLKADTQED